MALIDLAVFPLINLIDDLEGHERDAIGRVIVVFAALAARVSAQSGISLDSVGNLSELAYVAVTASSKYLPDALAEEAA